MYPSPHQSFVVGVDEPFAECWIIVVLALVLGLQGLDKLPIEAVRRVPRLGICMGLAIDEGSSEDHREVTMFQWGFLLLGLNGLI